MRLILESQNLNLNCNFILGAYKNKEMNQTRNAKKYFYVIQTQMKQGLIKATSWCHTENVQMKDTLR